MAGSSNLPLVSIIIPTLNSSSVLEACLKSIKSQKYFPLEIIIADGGSVDKTIAISQKYGALVHPNPLKTAEAGKAIAISKSKGKYTVFIDSDNILPDSDWLTKMLIPLESDLSLVGSEPWEYSYRPNGGFIERWSTLTGVNDPFALIAGHYDRRNFIRPSWTSLPLQITDYPNYQKVILTGPKLPTIGANGTIYRSSFLKNYFSGKYFFDTDFLTDVLSKIHKPISFAKIKTGIIHTFCESSITKFYRKQLRRSTDLYLYRHLRTAAVTQNNTVPIIKFILYVVLVIPMFFDTVKGFLIKPDYAWFFHPIACLITLYSYSLSTIKFKLGSLTPIDRNVWHQ